MLQGAREPRVFDDVEESHEVDVGIKRRLGDAAADIHLCRMMADHLGRKGDDGGGCSGVADVGDDEPGAGVKLLTLSRGEVVDDDDVVAVGQEPVDKVGTDEAGAAGDKNPHGRPIARVRSAGSLDDPSAPTDSRGMMSVGSFRFLSLALCAGGLTSASCASNEAANGDTAASFAGAQRIDDDTFNPDKFQRRDLDLNKDGKPDAYQFVQIVDDQPRIVRKEIDVNFDGKVDVIRILDDKGNLIEERLDTDFDGKIDVVVHFQNGQIVLKTYDMNFDNKIDVWRTFEKGVIVKEEGDMNFDGVVDLWEYYEGGVLDRVGVDRNGDGTVDEWQSRDAG